MTDATSLTPPKPGLSATLFSLNKSVELYRSKRPENVKKEKETLYPYIDVRDDV